MNGTDEFERSARFWLRAYPVRWRAVRGDELVDVLRDLAGPDATRLPLREGLGLLRAGWATRWRDGPPIGTRLAYRLFDRPIPPRYREWARDDIDGRWFLTRRMMRTVLAWSALFVPWMASVDPRRLVPFVFLWVPVLGISVFLDLFPPTNDRVRTLAVLRHLLPRPGEPVAPGGFAAGSVPRVRLAARAGTGALAGALAASALLWVPATLLAHRLPVPLARPAGAPLPAFGSQPWPTSARLLLVGAALGLGLAAALVARRRFARLLPTRPPQPARVLVARLGRQYAALVVVGPLVVWEAWLSTGVSQTAVLAPVGATATVLLLPGALVAWRAARSGPVGADLSDVAFVDLWRVGVLGRAPRVDAPATGVVRRPAAPRPVRP